MLVMCFVEMGGFCTRYLYRFYHLSSVEFSFCCCSSLLKRYLCWRHFPGSSGFRLRRRIAKHCVCVRVVASLTMSATISTGINSTIEVHGANAQVHATVPERGDLTFVLLPSETYHVHLHDIHGRLVVALRLRIPGPVRNNGVDGGSG